MHAYLLIGKGGYEDFVKKLKAKTLPFPLQKIDDVRSLNSLIKLSFNEPTVVICENIHEATEEALNAFLKNLEEPQENLSFILTAPSAKKVLPTIVSRCQVVRILDDKYVGAEGEPEKFLDLSVTEKLNYIDRIRDRKEAIELADNLINFMHRKLHEKEVKYTDLARKLELVSETYSCLKKNGNVNLHLSKMAINL